MMLYISMKFHENILKGFQVTEWTGNDNCQFQRRITTKLHIQELWFLYRQELWFLCFARQLMMFYISMKFHDNI